MEKKKALLILVGGRPMPNMLTILHKKPDIIVAITSKDVTLTSGNKKDERIYLKQSIKQLLRHIKPRYHLDTEYIVDAFNINEIKAECKRALDKYPNADWLFNITAATTLMSIAAYEVAQEHPEQVEWCYLDTGHRKVVSKTGSQQNEQLFTITVEQYITACYCSLISGDQEGYRSNHETTWLDFAQSLGKNLHRASLLKEVLQIIQKTNQLEKRQITAKTPQSYQLKGLPSESISMLAEAAKVCILKNWEHSTVDCSFLLEEPAYKFLDGTWLEVYTWNEARQAGIFSNLEWGKKFKDRYGRTSQLDVAMIYKAQLLIVECKTGGDAFRSETFQTLESIANALGRGFVVKILVTSLPIPEENRDDILSRTGSTDISIISRDEIPKLASKLAEIAIKHMGN